MTATITQIINVTAAHIAKGARGEACNCPIALAIGDQILEDGSEATVACGYALVGDHMADLPPEAVQFVQDFDDGKHVEPFAFALDVTVSEEAP